ncbi:hypothetical protein [Candidatus Nitrosocosmicus arcticus]|uniref:Uncharacterized protein n=1 Tax=Candidatus Nitrosocosmicus arcticus TaxID=2035267 RepID=A0A557SYZ4_9ARCH|nr:hypothetical protein [Candidatus Nitrosocosmicus arcticus]TVP41826.1 hypothetical protein NARC_10232 [Candidatus Nitrosocosmicus arcticus]
MNFSNYKSTIEQISTKFNKILNDTYKFIRKKCSLIDIDKAIELYEPILNLEDVATIRLFTINYDLAIERTSSQIGISILRVGRGKTDTNVFLFGIQHPLNHILSYIPSMIKPF